MSDGHPFRDERVALRTENAELRRELAQLNRRRVRRGVRAAVVAVTVCADVVIAEVARACINAPNDGRAALGFALVAGLVGLNVAVALWLTARRE